MKRMIDLEGCLNFRDLGGHPTADGRQVRWRQVFRSDALHLLTDADLGGLREEVGLCAVVDLRSSAERGADYTAAGETPRGFRRPARNV